MIGSAFHRISQIGGVTVTISHNDWRKVRRTSRTLLKRRPSAVAIIGEEAVTRPRQIRLKAKLRLRPSAEAASGRAPSRPISSTSVAWINAIVKLARISGQASASVAPDFLAPGRGNRAVGDGERCQHVRRLACRWPAPAMRRSKSFGLAMRGRLTAGKSRQRTRSACGSFAEFGSCWSASRTRSSSSSCWRSSGCSMPGCRPSRKPVGEGVLLVELDGTVVEQPAQPDRRRALSGQGNASPISPARPDSGARRGQGR